MKKLIFTLSIVLVSLLGYSQITNVGEFRIINDATAFGANLPLGTKVYNIATGEYWVATAGVVSTATLSTASASFTQLNDSGTDDQTASEVNITDEGNHFTGTTVESALHETGTSIADHQTSIDQNANAINTNVVNILTNTAVITSVESVLQDADDAMALQIDSHQASIVQNTSDISTNTAAITTTNSITTVLDAKIEDNTANIVTNAADIATNSLDIAAISTDLSLGTVNATTMEVVSSNGNSAILTAATSSVAGVMTAAQVTKLDGIASNSTNIIEKFEEVSTTATAHPLTQTAIVSQGCIVSVNGVILAPDSYTFVPAAITINVAKVPVYQYDQIVIVYSY